MGVDEGSITDAGWVQNDVENSVGIETSALAVAAERTVERLARSLKGDGREAVVRSVRALVQMLTADESTAAGTSSGDPVLREAAGALSVELVRCWKASPEVPEVKEVLRLIDALQTIEARWTAADAPEGKPFEENSKLDVVVEFAHDLRSPLTSILFLSETLRRRQPGELNPIQHRQVGIIYSAALNLVSLASDVIDLARGGDRLMDRRPSQFSVSEMLESICDVVAPLVEEKKVSLRVVGPPVGVRRGYPVALSRVLLNLLSNALRYTSEGFVEITTQPLAANYVEFSVRDTGVGMGEESGSAAFEPAVHAALKGRFGFSGSGLGLTICHRLLRAMESELHYETAPGWGTRFHFRVHLPYAELP